MELHSDELNKNKNPPPPSQCEESGGGSILPSSSRCSQAAGEQLILISVTGNTKNKTLFPFAVSLPPAYPTTLELVGEGFSLEWRRRNRSCHHCYHQQNSLIALWSGCDHPPEPRQALPWGAAAAAAVRGSLYRDTTGTQGRWRWGTETSLCLTKNPKVF